MLSESMGHEVLMTKEVSSLLQLVGSCLTQQWGTQESQSPTLEPVGRTHLTT